jgi:hypothetical protein
LYFVNLPDLNRRVSVTHGFDHVFEGKRLDYLQGFAFDYVYRGQPVSYGADYRFVARRS